MQLYLIRHANATPLGENGITEDALRPLTSKGHEQARAIGPGLLRRGVRLGALVSSPLLRARETAEDIAQTVGERGLELKTCDDLAPGGKRKQLRNFIRDLGVDSAALVGHLPDLGEFAAWLIGSKKAQIDLAKAGVACIHFEEAPGKGK